ncbi:MAG: hypothetical protein U9O78_00205 [Patescibacteria group bacterium]|nr:hypothetical protein [Patescibacteria group bacterium]
MPIINTQSNHNKQGQIGIIIILVMTILLTIGISIGLRTSKKQEISIEQEESTRVFNSAESGVEKALSEIYERERAGEEVGGDVVSEGTDEYQIETNSELEMYVEQGSSVKAALDSPTNSDDAKIDWWLESGTSCSSDNPAAILISIYNEAGGVTTSRYLAYDHCYASGDRNNNLIEPDSSSREGYSFSATVTLQAGDSYLRITPLYNSTKIYLASSEISKGQYDIISRARNTDDNVAKAIDVSRSLPAAPAFMDYALVSGSSLSK